MSHTPGPWTVDETKALGAYGVWTDYATCPGHDGAGYASQICSVFVNVSIGKNYFGGKNDGEIDQETRGANARLIAAAPDLLAACKAALLKFNHNPLDKVSVAGDMLREAIAKAEGSPS